MNIDDLIRAECEAERAIREVLLDLQRKTGRPVDWVKVDYTDCSVQVSLRNANAR